MVGLGFASISTDITDTLASDVDADGDPIYISSDISTKINWADEKSPPLAVGYDNINQQMTFTADRGVLGTGGEGDLIHSQSMGMRTRLLPIELVSQVQTMPQLV